MALSACDSDGRRDVALGSRQPLDCGGDIAERTSVHDLARHRLVPGEPAGELVGMGQDLLGCARHQGFPLRRRYFLRATSACTMTGPSSLSTTPTSSSLASRAGPMSMVSPSSTSSELMALR